VSFVGKGERPVSVPFAIVKCAERNGDTDLAKECREIGFARHSDYFSEN